MIATKAAANNTELTYTWSDLLQQLLEKQSLTVPQATDLMQGWLTDAIPPVLTGAILAAIQAQKPKRLKDVFLFDHYESDTLGADKKSLALGMIYQDAEKTLTTEEIDTMHNGLWTRLQTALPITLR